MTAVAGAAAIAGGGCDRLSEAPSFREFLAGANRLTLRAQRTLMWRQALAREFSPAEISRTFRANGSQDANSLPPGYLDAAARGFADWRLRVDGLVMRPTTFSLMDLRALPARTQITRHDCVEGWSCIGQWKGPQLSTLLERVSLRSEARFVIFHCADELTWYTDGSNSYYESIDLVDAFHPQTILAYEMNGVPLPVPHGAPLRLRLERQLGYKMAKFLSRIEVVDRLGGIRGGRGGTWEDQGYDWYAGI
jgi:DMSO/TMAO reductase YedYZ molybdopterin-dependent catalytic subunit